MRLAQKWIGVDVIATRDRGRIVVHSAGGQRQNRLLERCASELGLGRLGEELLTGLIKAELDPVLELWGRPDYSPKLLQLNDLATSEGRLEWRTHWITAPDGHPVGLVVWLAEGPVAPRPIYNSWILDLVTATTQSAGDDIRIIGSDRKVGEPRPIRDLLQFVNAVDAANFLALYWDARTAPRGTVAEAMWSIKTPDAVDWVHFWSAAHAKVGPTDKTVYGMSVQLPFRPEGLDLTLRQISHFNRNTLILLDADQLLTVHASGALRDELTDDDIIALAKQIDLDNDNFGSGVTETVTIKGHRYEATAWPLPSVQNKPVRPVAIALRPLDEG